MKNETLINKLRIYAISMRLQELLLEERETLPMPPKPFEITKQFELIPRHLGEYKDGKQLRRERRKRERKQ
jgi:hypothetical protein